MRYRLNCNDKIFSKFFDTTKEAEAYISEFKTYLKDDNAVVMIEYIDEINLQHICELTKKDGANKALIQILLKDKVKLTKKEIQYQLGLSAPTVSRILIELNDQIDKEVESLTHGVKIFYKIKKQEKDNGN